MNCWRELKVEQKTYRYASVRACSPLQNAAVATLPVSLKILLENVLRNNAGKLTADAEAVINWAKTRVAANEIAFKPARILMHDGSGIPVLADLAAMRDAIEEAGGDPSRVNPRIPIDLVVDHSVVVDRAGTPSAEGLNTDSEIERNQERYSFLRWAGQAFEHVRIIPPGNGICHQVNLEFLAQVVRVEDSGGIHTAYPDTLIGTDSHTPMINSLGVLGWGVGGIEAVTALLGEPIGMQVPTVVGCRLTGMPAPGVSTTDVVLTVTERLRRHGVTGDFVEFCGPGVAVLSLPERATLANMAPEYGATCAMFPIDRQTIRYLEATGRDAHQLRLVEAYARAQSLWRSDDTTDPVFSALVEIDLSTVVPSAAGPKRPQDRLELERIPESFKALLTPQQAADTLQSDKHDLIETGDVAIAAITSCTNTSNPYAMIAAGLLARNSVARGLRSKPWVKTSLSPGSRIVADYLQNSGLQSSLDVLGYQVAGFGCMTCMGNSGPLAPAIETHIRDNGTVVAAVLSGNRNFEGRIHPLARANYLVSPALVIAFALSGSVLHDVAADPLGDDHDGRPVFLKDIWPSEAEVNAIVEREIAPSLYAFRYGEGFAVPARWAGLPASDAKVYAWNSSSTYIRKPPFLDQIEREPAPIEPIIGARALLVVGDSVTTDHISPVSAIHKESLAGQYLIEQGVAAERLSSFMSRRVNHDVMLRGTFSNAQFKNEITPGQAGGTTRHFPDGGELSVFDAARAYETEGVPLIVIGGRDYGAGSSRDWAAKGTGLMGVRAIVAESFERIHRSNLIGMGVLPLEFPKGVDRKTLAIVGDEKFDIHVPVNFRPNVAVTMTIHRVSGEKKAVELLSRIDTEHEGAWYRHGGILDFAYRAMLAG